MPTHALELGLEHELALSGLLFLMDAKRECVRLEVRMQRFYLCQSVHYREYLYLLKRVELLAPVSESDFRSRVVVKQKVLLHLTLDL